MENNFFRIRSIGNYTNSSAPAIGPNRPPDMNDTNDIITIIDEAHMALFFHPEHRIVHHEIRTQLPEGEFQKLLSAGVELMIKHKAEKWLSDDHKQHHITPEDNDWGDRFWAPRAIEAGFKFWAVVPPAKGLGKIQLRRFVEENAARGVTAETFSTYESALEWLKQQ